MKTKDKKLWFAVHCCKQTVAPVNLPVSTGMLFGVGAMFLLISAAIFGASVFPVHATGISAAGIVLASRPKLKTNSSKIIRPSGLITNEAAVAVQSAASMASANGTVFRRILNAVPRKRKDGSMETNAEAQVRALRPYANEASPQTNDLLRKDEWKQLDAAMVEIAAVRLRPLEVLRQRGLVKQLDGLGVLLSQWEQLSDLTDAEVNMSGVTRTQEDTGDVTLNSIPVPIISKDFRIGLRHLLASRRGPNGAGGGEGIDVTQVRQATRKVSEKMVDMLFNGITGKLDGNSLLGLTNATNVNTVSGGDWGTVANVYDNVISAITALQGDRMFGPYGMFVSNTQYLQMLTYISNVNQTALMRVMSIPGIQFVEPADQLTDGTAVIFQLTADVIDVAFAMDMAVVQWDENGGLTEQFKIMAAYAPRPKSDYDGRSGIAYISGI